VTNQTIDLYGSIYRKIKDLTKHNDRASLAKLRRGLGKKPGHVPEVNDFILGVLSTAPPSNRYEATRTEWAAHITMTLFALHQQGKHTSMNNVKMPLGSAVRKLIFEKGESSEKSIKRRFDAVITSGSPEEVAHHLRGIIQLLRSEGMPISYPRLAEDLYWFQFPEYRDGVRLAWGREYYYYKNEKDDEKNE
jgi:CRISPR system Cascade subunit CasB